MRSWPHKRVRFFAEREQKNFYKTRYSTSPGNRTDHTVSSRCARFFSETLFSPPIMTTKNQSDELSPTYNDVPASELASAMDQDELQLVIPR